MPTTAAVGGSSAALLPGLGEDEIHSFMKCVTHSASNLNLASTGGSAKDVSMGNGEPMEASTWLDEHFDFTKVRKVQLSWKDLSYHVAGAGLFWKKATQKAVLLNVSGTANPGHLMAVMGPTGCGKSSLLNALAGRLPKSGTLHGEVLVNGTPRSEEFRSYTAYSLQDDALFANLTVRETFWIAANLRLPSKTTKEHKRKAVQAVIMAMGLAKAADTRVGDSMRRGVSGGERKRTNIAVELISNPSIIFLDEPTSGLDSFQAQSVMEALLNLARGGRTVISVIHQPRSSIFHMFDQLCLLSEGRVMYIGDAHMAHDYFAGLGFPCPPQFNAADFFLDLVSMDYRMPEAEESSRRRINALADHYLLSASHTTGNVELSISQAVSNRTGFSVGFLKQFAVLLRRSVMQNLRDHVTNLILLVQAIFLAVLLGLIYIDLDKSQLGIQDRLGVLFFITINSCMGSMFSVMQSFPAEKAIVSRERDARAYSTAAYFLSKVISEIPFKTYNMVVNGTILYWMIGFNPLVDRFLFFVLTQCCLSMSAASIGLMVGSWCPTQETTFAVSPLFMIILMLFGGFFINPDSLPPGSQWVAYISPMNWGFRAFALNDLAGADGWVCDLACVPAGSSDSCGNQPVTDEQHQALSCPEGQVAVVRPGCLQTGDEIIELRLGYDDYTKWECILYMLLSTIGFLSVGYVGLVVTRSRYQPLTNILPSEDLQQEPARNKAPQHNQVGVEGV